LSHRLQLTITPEPFANVAVPLLGFPVFEDELEAVERHGPALAQAASAAREEAFKGRAGESLLLRDVEGLAAARLCLVGLGKRVDWLPEDVRGLVATVVSSAEGRGLSEAGLAFEPLDGVAEAANLAAFAAEGAVSAGYRFDRYRRAAEDDGVPPARLERLQLIGATPAAHADAVQRGQVLGEAICRARDWVNEPPNICTPTYLADQAEQIAAETGLEVATLQGLEALQAERMELFAAVARGSAEPPALIHLVYRADGDLRRRVALVGKGVTYDSGGYSLKPPKSQVGMHADMAGGAAVLAAALAVGRLRPVGVEAHFIVPAAENLVSGQAYRVNDIVVGRTGVSVEISNTDAEGRLLLADALALAAELEVDAIVDIATLTGGNYITFGGMHAGVMSNNDALADELLAAGAAAGEGLWRLPLTRRLAKKLKSNVADTKNAGGREGTTITGALFLERFVGDTPWVHIDMAGLERADESWQHVAKGATGFGVTSLFAFVARGGERA
jgi:leucyl aminopeptidase